ncbi:MAG: hypothetical protein HFF17_01250 [Oscillospiraceae bacterium]|nr:hypothetical protein [Oscillospiraceae bacterium]
MKPEQKTVRHPLVLIDTRSKIASSPLYARQITKNLGKTGFPAHSTLPYPVFAFIRSPYRHVVQMQKDSETATSLNLFRTFFPVENGPQAATKGSASGRGGLCEG